MSDDTLQAGLEESRRQERAGRATQRASGTADQFAEITTTQMDRGWVGYDRGMPGTLAAQRGGFWWCVRCFRTETGQPDFAESHVCEDIASGSRRWVRKDLVPAVRQQTAAGEAEADGARANAGGSEIRARRA